MTETERKLLADIQRIYEAWRRKGPACRQDMFDELNPLINAAHSHLKPLKEEVRQEVAAATEKMNEIYWADKKQANGTQNKG